MTSPQPDTNATVDPNLPYVTESGVTIAVGDVVIYHDAAGDFPALVVALNATAKTVTLQEFNLAAPGLPLTGVALGNATGQWEPRQATK